MFAEWLSHSQSKVLSVQATPIPQMWTLRFRNVKHQAQEYSASKWHKQRCDLNSEWLQNPFFLRWLPSLKCLRSCHYLQNKITSLNLHRRCFTIHPQVTSPHLVFSHCTFSTPHNSQNFMLSYASMAFPSAQNTLSFLRYCPWSWCQEHRWLVSPLALVTGILTIAVVTCLLFICPTALWAQWMLNPHYKSFLYCQCQTH